MSELDLLPTDVEQDLRTTVRDLLASRCAPDDVTAMYDGNRSLVDGLWKALGIDLGLAGLLVPEDQGGAGASAREAAVVLEELGRTIAPVPFLTSSVIATSSLLGSGSSVLASLASGEQTAALAVPWSTAPHGRLAPVARDAEGRLNGRITSVAGALEADVLLVPVQHPDGIELVAVPVGDVRIEAVTSLDMSRQLADLDVTGAVGEVVVPAAAGEQAVRRGLLTGAALLASEQVGPAEWCLAATVSYLKDRRQFGRVVGGFQALKHRLADLYTEVQSAGAVARYAAVAVAEDDPDVAAAASLAQAYCSDVAVHAAEEAVQLHGGIGMTWEHPVHLYLKRAKSGQMALGTPGSHRARLAELVDLPPA